jgi:hypothetical protein
MCELTFFRTGIENSILIALGGFPSQKENKSDRENTASLPGGDGEVFDRICASAISKFAE